MQTLGQSGTYHPSTVMIALGLLLLSTTFASACIDWKSVDLKKPEIPSMGDVDVFIEESQSVDIQVTNQIAMNVVCWCNQIILLYSTPHTITRRPFHGLTKSVSLTL